MDARNQGHTDIIDTIPAVLGLVKIVGVAREGASRNFMSIATAAGRIRLITDQCAGQGGAIVGVVGLAETNRIDLVEL